MDDTTIRYAYIGSTKYTSIEPHSKSDYESFKPETYQIKIFFDNTTDFEKEIILECCTNYSIGIYGTDVDLIKENK